MRRDSLTRVGNWATPALRGEALERGRVKLSCKHWSRPMDIPDIRRALDAGTATCPHCGAHAATTGKANIGGLSATRSAELLADWERRSSAYSRPRLRSDGLMVAHISSETKDWWCRWCDGRKAHHARGRATDGMRGVFAEWDIHKISDRHRASLADNEAVDRFTRLLEGSSFGE